MVVNLLVRTNKDSEIPIKQEETDTPLLHLI